MGHTGHTEAVSGVHHGPQQCGAVCNVVWDGSQVACNPKSSPWSTTRWVQLEPLGERSFLTTSCMRIGVNVVVVFVLFWEFGSCRRGSKALVKHNTMRSKRAGLNSSEDHRNLFTNTYCDSIFVHARVPTTLLIIHAVNDPPYPPSWILVCTIVSPGIASGGHGVATPCMPPIKLGMQP